MSALDAGTGLRQVIYLGAVGMSSKLKVVSRTSILGWVTVSRLHRPLSSLPQHLCKRFVVQWWTLQNSGFVQ